MYILINVIKKNIYIKNCNERSIFEQISLSIMLPIMSTKSDWYSSLNKYNNIIIVSIKNNFLCILIIIIFIIMKYTIIKNIY